MGMNLKEALEEITLTMIAWGKRMNGLNDNEKEALKVITAHCRADIGTINAMKERKCFNVIQKMEKGDNDGY